ncbi:transposase [Gluconobacter oxydans H24]|nr:transposase [Gluconobacter oxydans H24]
MSTGADDAVLRQRLRELADQRRRFGYHRLGYLLAREGFSPNHKKLFRLYNKEGGLKFRRQGGRKRALGTRSPITIPQEALEPGFCLGCSDLWSSVSHSGCDR